MAAASPPPYYKVLRIPWKNSFLLGGLQLPASIPEGREEATTRSCVVYLHGFPDQSVDHRSGLPNFYGIFSSRFPRKFGEFYAADTKTPNPPAFCAFNFSGSPGSEGGLKFRDKTVSQEVEDVVTVLKYLTGEYIFEEYHIVGLSTGAIIGALLRRRLLDFEKRLNVRSISIVAACGADVQEAVVSDVLETRRRWESTNAPFRYGCDFTPEQQKSLEERGVCDKEFWLPTGSPSNPPEARVKNKQTTATTTNGEDPLPTVTEDQSAPQQDRQVGGASAKQEADSATAKWEEHQIELAVSYRDDFLKLDIAGSVAFVPEPGPADGAGEKDGLPIPLLFVHGTDDKDVPLAAGKALFEKSANPTCWVEISKGNHLMTNSKQMKKTIAEVWNFQREHSA